MKNFIKKSTILIIVLIFILGLAPALSSCGLPKPPFENIVISGDEVKDTSEPINPKNEFDISAKQIFATVKYFGKKGSDNWHFKWTYVESGEIVLDDGEKYNNDEPNTIFEGIVSSNISAIDNKIIPLGNYKVEFFNNGELINTANFKINKPQMKIIEVSLANAVDESGVPINKSQHFSPSETVYATAKLDYLITGNSLKALWKDSAGKVLNEVKYDVPDDYYVEPSYIWFKLKLTGRQVPIGPGKYKVEIYLNDSLHGTYDFEVIEDALVTFNQGKTL